MSRNRGCKWIITMLLAVALAIGGSITGIPPLSTTADAAIAPGAGDPNDGVDFAALVDSGVYYGTYRHAESLSGTFHGNVFRYESSAVPILWRVMGEEANSGKLTLLSEYVLDSKQFGNGEVNGANYYNNSPIRTWLDTFGDNNFLNVEKDGMARTNIVTGMYLDATGAERTGTYSTGDYTYSNTTALPWTLYSGKIYLPWGVRYKGKLYWTAGNDPDEGSLPSSMKTATLRNGSEVRWWLRSPHSGSSTGALSVSSSGDAGNSFISNFNGVRPAFQLDPASVLHISEVGGSGPGDISADTNYSATNGSGKNHKLTIMNSAVSLTGLYVDTFQGDDLVGDGTEPLTMPRGEGLAMGSTAVDHGKLVYKIVESNGGVRSIVEYGAGSVTNLQGIGESLLDGKYTLYVWAQKDNAINSHEGSKPKWFPLTVGDGIQPSATVSDVTIRGTGNAALDSQTATIALTGDVVVSGGLSGADATGWFTGLPQGVTVAASGAAGDNTITLTFGGTPAAASTAIFNIMIPSTALARNKALRVTANADAKFSIALPDILITAAAIGGVTSPESGKTPSTGISNGTGFTASLSWDEDPEIFGYETQYTATIILTAASGYTFAGGFADTPAIAGFTVNGNSPVWADNEGSTLMFRVTFPATGADPRTPVTYKARQVGGTSGTATSTGIKITFSEAVTGLTADKITLTDDTGAAVMGSLSGDDDIWTIGLTGVTTEGDVTIGIADFGDFRVTTTGQSVTVYKVSALPTHTLTASSREGGSVSGSANGDYAAGDSISVTATADANYTFTGWTANGVTLSSNTMNPAVFDMPDNDVTLTANFRYSSNNIDPPIIDPPVTPTTFAISLSAQPAEGGSVAGGGSVEAGSPCTVTATANTGYKFLYWLESGAQVSANASYTFTVTAARTLMAVFEKTSGGSEGEGGTIGPQEGQQNNEAAEHNPVGQITPTNVSPTTGVGTVTLQEATTLTLLEQMKEIFGSTEGKALDIRIFMPAGMEDLNFRLTPATLGALKTAGISGLALRIGSNTLMVDMKLLEHLYKNAENTVRLRIYDSEISTKGGANGMYTVTASYMRGKETVYLKDMGGGSLTLRLPYTPAEGENPAQLYLRYYPEDGDPVALSDSFYDTAKRTLVGNATKWGLYGPALRGGVKYTDIGGHWAKYYIEYLSARNILGNASTAKFSPEKTITEAEFGSALKKLMGSEHYAQSKNAAGSITRLKAAQLLIDAGVDMTPVRKPYAFKDAGGETIYKVQQAGYMNPYSDGEFHGSDTLTRAQAAAILARVAHISRDGASATGWAFADDGKGRLFYSYTGVMVQGKQTIDGVDYSFGANGIVK